MKTKISEWVQIKEDKGKVYFTPRYVDKGVVLVVDAVLLSRYFYDAGQEKISLGSAVKEKREQMGWSQRDLARVIKNKGGELTQAALSLLESNRGRGVNTTTLCFLAEALNLSTEYLMDCHKHTVYSDDLENNVSLHEND